MEQIDLLEQNTYCKYFINYLALSIDSVLVSAVDKQELILLFWGFRALCKGQPFLTKAAFLEAFGSFDSPIVVDALFQGIDRNSDVCVYRKSIFLSIISSFFADLVFRE